MGRYVNELNAIKFFLGISGVGEPEILWSLTDIFFLGLGGGEPEILWSLTDNICSNLKRINPANYRDFEYCFKWWPGFSGNMNYPIPSGDSRTPEEAYYSVANGNRNFYDTNLNYCMLRMLLLTYIHHRLVEAESQNISLYELYLNKGYIKQSGVKPLGY